MKTKILFLGLLLSLLTVGCSKDKDDEATMTAEEMQTNAKLDVANDDITNSVEDQFDATTSNSMERNAVAVSSLLPNCATIVRNPAIGTALTAGTAVTKTITFAPGCVLRSGNIVSGSIIMSYVYRPLFTGAQTITISFSNFRHNNFEITGTKTLTRTLTVGTATAPSHPIVSININITATNFVNGNVYTRTGTRVREFIVGFNTPLDWADNVFKITGAWTTTHPNGNIQTADIISPVMVKFSCANTLVSPRPSVLSQGLIEFRRNSNVASLDFGNGICDNSAVFTINGIARTITIN